MKTKQVEVKVEHNGIPAGSVIYVDKTLKKDYKGTWPSMAGSYIVKVKKKFCKIIK